jgi:hypothetical protein
MWGLTVNFTDFALSVPNICQISFLILLMDREWNQSLHTPRPPLTRSRVLWNPSKYWHTYCCQIQRCLISLVNICYMFRSYWPSSGFKIHEFCSPKKSLRIFYMYMLSPAFIIQGRAPHRNSDVTRFCHTHSYARALRGRGNYVCLVLLHCCLICDRSAELCIVILLIQFSHRVLQMSLIPPLLMHLIERT